MAPKKDKFDVTADDNWRRVIEDTPLDDETFTVKVVIIEAAGSDQDLMYMNKFELFAAEEKRFGIKNISKTETIFMVNQLGCDATVEDDNLRVFQEGQAFLKENKGIPSDILALIIKYLILKMKEVYPFIKRNRLEVKEGVRRESETMIGNAEVRGTVNVKPPEEPPPTVDVKGKGNPDKIQNKTEPMVKLEEGKKYNTLLRVRGEEWRDKVYVHDYPIDGPNLYVAVTGFLVPSLPSSLLKIGIPLTAVVQVRIDPNTTEVPSDLTRATKRGQSQTEIFTEIYNFWNDLQLMRVCKNSADDYRNTAFIVFSPPYWNTESLSGDSEKIYDEICFLMYDVQDLTRQHNNYLENMTVVYIPKSSEEERYEKYYHQQIDDIPLECVTIFSVLDSMLQTVCHSQGCESSSGTSMSTLVTVNKPLTSLTEDEKIEKAENFVKEVFNTLCKTEANKKAYRLTYGEEYENHKSPTVINYGDFAKYPTFHLGNINMDNIVWSSLYRMPLHKLWDTQARPVGELEAKINFHVNVLLSCFQRKDVETAELNRLIHILACRKLFNNRSSLKKKHLPSSTISNFKKIFLKRSVLAEPLSRSSSLHKSYSSTTPSFPSMAKSENQSDTPSYGEDPETHSVKYLFDCPDISELVSAAELVNGSSTNHLINDFECFEDFSGVSAFQITRDAFNNFNCVDYKYCEVTDSFVLMFFNSHDKDGISREEWRSHLSTPICLEDFFDFVLEENYEWFQTQEKIYDESIKFKSKSDNKVVVDPNASKSCIGDLDVGLDLLMESSLKYQELTKIKETPNSTYSSTDGGNLSQKLFTSKTSIKEDEVRSKNIKRPKSPSNMTDGTLFDTFAEFTPKQFIGYDLGDRRVEVFGRDATYFSRDGTRVHCMYTLIIPTNKEYIIMKVVPGNSCNEFWFHRALGDEVTPTIIDSCESFRISSKNQVLINIKKQSYHVPLPLTLDSNMDVQIQELFETRSYHSLSITWPNGLITESVHDDNSPAISHIKQYQVSSMLKLEEDMRCISLYGEVLIFKTSGDIHVLKPDGSFIKITKFNWKKVVPTLAEKSVLTTESLWDKSKKEKSKEKIKEKPGKVTSKLKQGDIINKEEDKLPQYELVVEEFEFIETSGLRQKWINNIPVTIENLLIRTATDFNLGEVFMRRMDGTHILLNKEGIQIVTFPDKTRIITQFIVEDEEVFPDWTDEEKDYYDLLGFENVDIETNKSKDSFISQKSCVTSQASIASSITKTVEIKEVDTENVKKTEKSVRKDGYISVQIMYTIENANFTTVTIEKASDKITVESPNNTAVVIDSDNNYNIILDSATTADFDGENLRIKYEACPECRAFTTCDIKIKDDEISSALKCQRHWLKMKDSFCKQIEVNEEGSISLVENLYPDETGRPEDACVDEPTENCDDRPNEGKYDNSMMSHGKCREMYLAKTLRFLILRRELACTELVHRSLLDQYKRDCRWQPWCSINQYDVFGDQRSLLSLLTPVHLTETEKWLMESKFADKPKYLTYKDLKKDCGKGFYHWMRPYERFKPQPLKPENVLPPRLPRAFVLRTLEQQWKESERDKYKGAKELLTAILQYRRIMEVDSETLLYVPIVDSRPEHKRRVDDVIQALAHRMYEDLTCRLANDVDTRAKAGITTKPSVSVVAGSVEEEQDEELTDESKLLEEERDTMIRHMEDVEEVSPNLNRYWRRRAEECKEEEFYKSLLRESGVPPYFHDVQSGAMWWEMNKTAGDAVTLSERRKMKCVCPDEEASNADVEPYM